MTTRNLVIDTNVLKEAMTRKGLGSSELAKKAGISRWSVIRAKKGTCSPWHIHLISKALGIKESVLIQSMEETERK